MHNFDDKTRKEVLGEVLMDELKAIREYVEDVPRIKEEVHQIKVVVNEMNERMTVVEAVMREQDSELRKPKRKAV